MLKFCLYGLLVFVFLYRFSIMFNKFILGKQSYVVKLSYVFKFSDCIGCYRLGWD